MDRIRRLSMQVLELHKDKFTTGFAENKKILGELAIVRSKGLKNEVAGYITKYLKREVDTKAAKAQEEQESDEVQDEEQVKQEAEQETEEGTEQEIEEEIEEDSTPQEILVENQQESS